MTRTPGCICTRARRDWQSDGSCSRCGNRVLEVQIMDVVRATLVSDPRCLIWRNEIGASSHYPDGTARKHPIKYGVGGPGGSDLLGLYDGRFLAVECKTVRGRESPAQLQFAQFITQRNGVYAVCRSELDARQLLESLQGGVGIHSHGDRQ